MKHELIYFCTIVLVVMVNRKKYYFCILYRSSMSAAHVKPLLLIDFKVGHLIECSSVRRGNEWMCGFNSDALTIFHFCHDLPACVHVLSWNKGTKGHEML